MTLVRLGEIDIVEPSACPWDLHELHFVHGPLERVGLGLDLKKFSILLVVYIWNNSKKH